MDYQRKINQEREVARQLRMEREEEKQRKAQEEENARKEIKRRRTRATTLNLGDMEARDGLEPEPEPQPDGPASEPEDPVDEPTGSFRRRRAAHSEVMQKLKEENPRADRRAAPPMGHQWREINRGLNGLFRLRPQVASKANQNSSVMTGFRTQKSAPIPSMRQKALRRQMGVLEEFYEVGEAGRVLGEVDKSFRKRRANPHGVTKEWVQDVDRRRAQLAPWAASDPEAVFGRQTETVAQRRERLRSEMASKRRERESKMTGEENEENGAFTLRTNEHASLGLQLALQREARNAKREEKLRDVARPIGAHVPTDIENRVAACIVPLCAQAQSKSVEVQRDVAAALYSLSIADENKPAFIEAQALETLIAMAQSKDPDIRRNIAGAMYRLSMCTAIKRPFVELGVLRPLLVLAQGSKDREVQRYSMLAVKELCEKRANHVDIINANALPILFSHLDSTDPRIRKEAIWTLNHLADDEANRLRMLHDGALDKMLQFVNAQDVALRRGSASTLFLFSKLKEVAPADIVKQLTSKETLSSLIAALADRDLEVSADLCRTLAIMKSTKLTKMMLTQKGLVHLFAHASRLVDLDGTGDIHTNLTQVMTVLLTFMPAKYPKNVMAVMDEGYMSTLLHLCKYNSGKVRRSAGKLLARLSTIEASKEKMMADPDTVPLLISLCKQSDYSSQMTAVKVIAELAEEAKNRTKLFRAAVLPTLFECIRKGDDEMRFQCARAIADMAEAVELRVAIVYAGLEQILECMLSEDDQVQEQGMRILVNLAAPAGYACGADEGGVGRYGALEALQVDDDLDDEDSSSSDDDSGDSGDSDTDDSDGDGQDKGDDTVSSAGGGGGSNEAHAMDAIADMIDDQKLHAAKSPEKASPTKPINFAAAGGLSGGGMGGMAGMAAGAEESDDSSEEEEDDYDEADEEADAKKAAALATRSNVLARARMLVHKAQIIEGEKERELIKNGTEAGPGGLAGLAMAEAAAAAAAAAAEAAGGRGKKPKPAKVSLTTASVKAESNFSRYRRQSAFTLAEEKRREDAAEEQKKIESNAPKQRRLSVGWGDMATLLGTDAGASEVDEQSDEWWTTEEGKRIKTKHNTINVDRIHLKIAETHVVKRLLELVFDDTPHVSEYAEAVVSFMVEHGHNKEEDNNGS